VIILADTSVWVDLWRHGNPRFVRMLEQETVLMHPFVLGELALGAVTDRGDVLGRLARLVPASVARHDEVLALIERAPLWGRGIGWVDAHLLASALLDRIRLWTLDAQLARVARELGVAA
jgi:predicted nucleic acid-binding protein